MNEVIYKRILPPPSPSKRIINCIRIFHLSSSILFTISPRYVFSRRKWTLVCGYFFSGSFFQGYDFYWYLFTRHLAFIQCMSVAFASVIVCCCIGVCWFCNKGWWFCFKVICFIFKHVFKNKLFVLHDHIFNPFLRLYWRPVFWNVFKVLLNQKKGFSSPPWPKEIWKLIYIQTFEWPGLLTFCHFNWPW